MKVSIDDEIVDGRRTAKSSEARFQFNSSLLFDPAAPPIDSFSGEFIGLSNLMPFPIEIKNIQFPTVEHAFQAMKSARVQDWKDIARLANAGDARRRGREIYARPDWDENKRYVMYKLLQEKFQSAAYRKLLLETWPRQLIEGNYWKDRYWGVYKGEGENWMGRLLMRVRLELIAEALVSW